MDQTVLTAIIYMDKYMIENPKVTIQIYQLVGIVCLMLAVKMHEDVVLTQEQGNYECGNTYNIDMICMVEYDIIKKLGFQLNYTTSLEFLIQILFHEESSDRYTQIQNLVEQCLPIIYMCQKDYNIGCAFSQF